MATSLRPLSPTLEGNYRQVCMQVSTISYFPYFLQNPKCASASHFIYFLTFILQTFIAFRLCFPLSEQVHFFIFYFFFEFFLLFLVHFVICISNYCLSEILLYEHRRSELEINEVPESKANYVNRNSVNTNPNSVNVNPNFVNVNRNNINVNDQPWIYYMLAAVGVLFALIVAITMKY